MAYEGPSAYIDPDEAALRNVPPGHYALAEDGSILKTGRGYFAKPVRLVAVIHDRDDPDNVGFHYEIAQKGDPIAKAGNFVPLSAHVEGKGGVSV